MTNLNNNGTLDRRFSVNKISYKEVKEHNRRLHIQQFLAVAILGFLAGAILTKTIWDSTQPLLSPLGQSIVPQVVEVQAAEKPFCQDVISCIRDVGEELGEPNKDIMQMIRIARHESNFRANAKNPTSSASGVFQIINGTWKSNKCIGDKFDYEANIRCAYHIHSHRGFQPWEVYNKGIAK